MEKYQQWTEQNIAKIWQIVGTRIDKILQNCPTVMQSETAFVVRIGRLGQTGITTNWDQPNDSIKVFKWIMKWFRKDTLPGLEMWTLKG